MSVSQQAWGWTMVVGLIAAFLAIYYVVFVLSPGPFVDGATQAITIVVLVLIALAVFTVGRHRLFPHLR